ncbi:hypothetical protein LTR84_008277 [Exophiala bonariae]|uniref:Xylanolytic transcriptional activator regulatory domain-containing protein n=1 Tax=Exophiala bonariae TaxID=1690606 RepID=A0AAV9MXZ5_9EURO|nr:hypothetical protein LTR84_008277 [Exophiala bonariae]
MPGAKSEIKCLSHNAECIYPESRRGRKKDLRGASASLEDRLARMETMMQARNNIQFPPSESSPPDNVVDDNTLWAPTQGNNHSLGDSVVWNSIQREAHSGSVAPPNERPTEIPLENLEGSIATSPPIASLIPVEARNSHHGISTLATHRSHDDTHQSPLSNRSDMQHGTLDTEASVLAPQMVNWEHHGPGSWLSVCSKPGLAWVAQRTGVNDFTDSARELVSTWTRRLSLTRKRLLHPQDHDPDPEVAWKYSDGIKAFFEDSLASTHGVVYRPEFESALRAHLQGDTTLCADPAWYALRKTVYASGCRIYKSKHTTASFAEIQTEAWSLLAVRALTTMTFFSEGLGNPALEYMLCTNAARVAQAKGLHRRPADTWNLSKHDELHFGWLFWAIYCCDKHIAHRSGRPSAIDDDDISCEIPNETCPGSTIDIQACTALITHAKLSSRISKSLTSVKAFRQSPSEFLQTATSLDAELREWRQSLPITMRPVDKLTAFRIPSNSITFSTTYIHYAYYGTLMAIHTMIAYPWIRSTVFDHDRDMVDHDQIIASSNIVADAARNIIVIARSLGIDAASIQWFKPLLYTYVL